MQTLLVGGPANGQKFNIGADLDHFHVANLDSGVTKELYIRRMWSGSAGAGEAVFVWNGLAEDEIFAAVRSAIDES